MAEYDSSVTIADSYSYDGYGVLLQDESVASADPGKVAPQATNLLYTGEHFDTDSQQYYLRARWYDALNGRFNRVDPYAGNNQDPQSLHKYLYCHANPVNAIDPSGKFSLTETLSNTLIQGSLLRILAPVFTPLLAKAASRLIPKEWLRSIERGVPTAIIGGAGISATRFGGHNVLIGGNIEAVGSLTNGNFGIYMGGRVGVASTGGATGTSISTSMYFGVVFNAEMSEDYEGPSVALSINYWTFGLYDMALHFKLLTIT